jgi:hypothetical protein
MLRNLGAINAYSDSTVRGFGAIEEFIGEAIEHRTIHAVFVRGIFIGID